MGQPARPTWSAPGHFAVWMPAGSRFNFERSADEEKGMTWIKTIGPEQAEGALKEALMAQRALYPKEYAGPPAQPSSAGANSIIASHSLIPGALEHAFSAFGALMSPDLPLERRHHEMIATVVSVTNRCRY